MPDQDGRAESLARLVAVVDRLRGPGGCPWDRRQTIPSLARFVIEETYELIEAIETGGSQAVAEELGDLLMLLLLIARIAEENAEFHIGDAADGIARKLVRRHPHVFGEVVAPTEREVLRNWEAIKRQEKPGRASPTDGIPRAAPALLQAYRIAERVARVEGALRPLPIAQAWQALCAARRDDDPAALERAVGSMLFSIAWDARDRGIEPEGALRAIVREYRSPVAPAAEEGGPGAPPSETAS
ncbi:MAG: MazG family protein [Planctomycetes bacterium]|nr:MazG family protein [Planctomycetota bacterium]